MHVTLRQLEYIIAVAETGSFSKAAVNVHAEQSTLSQQIKTLEERLGIVIFNRKTKPISVTLEGKRIIEQATYIINKVEELIVPFKANK